MAYRFLSFRRFNGGGGEIIADSATEVLKGLLNGATHEILKAQLDINLLKRKPVAQAVVGILALPTAFVSIDVSVRSNREVKKLNAKIHGLQDKLDGVNEEVDGVNKELKEIRKCTMVPTKLGNALGPYITTPLIAGAVIGFAVSSFIGR